MPEQGTVENKTKVFMRVFLRQNMVSSLERWMMRYMGRYGKDFGFGCTETDAPKVNPRLQSF